ncbi:hypothetical protein CLD22_13520 [Rubrivivax gelatinosus]|nr:hypothetical protein [Rubrivivax gelatinosus]
MVGAAGHGVCRCESAMFVGRLPVAAAATAAALPLVLQALAPRADTALAAPARQWRHPLEPP